MGAAFQSVTTRTAGFFTVPQGDLREESVFISCLLMFIGGSPAGTAGGVKTTTIAMLFLTAVTVVKGNKDTECFGRRIPEENIRNGDFSYADVFYNLDDRDYSCFSDRIGGIS